MSKDKEVVHEKISVTEKSMIGAIVGDIVGSRFEWHNRKTKDFELFVTMDAAVKAASREYSKQKAIEHEKQCEVKRCWKWWPFGRKKQRLGALMAQSGSLLSSSIMTDPDAPKHPFARTERPCLYTDDSVMTLAVAAALMDWRTEGGDLGMVTVRRWTR